MRHKIFHVFHKKLTLWMCAPSALKVGLKHTKRFTSSAQKVELNCSKNNKTSSFHSQASYPWRLVFKRGPGTTRTLGLLLISWQHTTKKNHRHNALYGRLRRGPHNSDLQHYRTKTTKKVTHHVQSLCCHILNVLIQNNLQPPCVCEVIKKFYPVRFVT